MFTRRQTEMEIGSVKNHTKIKLIKIVKLVKLR